MAKKYTNSEFKEKALKNTEWVESILDEYDSTIERIHVKGKCRSY